MKETRRNRIGVWAGLSAAIVILLVVIIVALKTPGIEDGVQHGRTYEMAAILPLTGNLAAIGTPKKEAMELALEEIGRRHPNLTLKIMYGDSLGNPRDGVAAFSKAISTDGASIAYVDLTTIVNACIPIADDKGVYTLAGSAEAKITERSPFIYRVFPGGDQEIDMIEGYLTSLRPAPSVFIVHTNEQYGRSVRKLLSDRLQSTSVKVLGAEEYSLGDSDFRAQMTKARESGAERIVMLGYGIRYAQILKQAQELGITPDRFISNLGAVNVTVTQLPAELTQGMVFAGPAFNLRLSRLDEYPSQKAMVDAYKHRYGNEPDFRVAFVYDSMMMLAAALDRVGTIDDLPTELIGQIYHGVSGRIEIAPNRDATVDMILARYDQGQIVELHKERSAPAEGEQ